MAMPELIDANELLSQTSISDNANQLATKVLDSEEVFFRSLAIFRTPNLDHFTIR
jgi:hypothetical protein